MADSPQSTVPTTTVQNNTTPSSNGFAVAALVVGIIAFFSGLVPFWGLIVGAAALILGIIALKKAQNKGMSLTGIILGGIAVLTNLIVIMVLVGGIAAVNEASTATTSETGQSVVNEKSVFAVDEVIEFDNKKVTVSNVERNWSSGNEFVTPENGNEFVKAQVTIENNSDQEASYNTYDWKIQDSNGVIKDVSSASFMSDGALSSGELTSGGKVSGFLVFEVPAGDDDLTLRYEPSFWSDKKLEIKL